MAARTLAQCGIRRGLVSRHLCRSYLDPADRLCEPLAHDLTTGWSEGLLPHATYVVPTAADRSVTPLYTAAVASGTAARHGRLAVDGTRGRLLLVTHDM
jgi:hypothetical protein